MVAMVIVFEDYELLPGSYQLLHDGEPVKMEPQVFDVLAYLVANRDRVVPKEELLDNVWGDRFVSESALTSRIRSARLAVGDNGKAQRLIRNAHGRGYQFVGEAREQESADIEPESSASAASSSASTESASHELPSAMDRIERIALSVDEEFPFVGRRGLLEEADRQLETVDAGATGALLIGGEPGIGKTRLAAELGRRAASRRILPLAGRCDRHLATSLQPWLEALAVYVDTSPVETLETDTEGIAGHLRTVFPSLDARLGHTDGVHQSSTDEYAVIDAIVVLLERISARRPLLVVLDDVQWAGGSTRALASLLLRRAVARILVVLTFRTTIDDLDDAARDWLAELGDHQGAARVDLEGLEHSEVSALAAGVLGLQSDDEVGRQVFSMSEGHSLFATELLRDVRGGVGVDHLPDSVADLVRTRVERLPDDVSKLVTAGAAIGQDFDLGVAAAAADLDLDGALDAIEVALGAELVHEVDGGIDSFRFSHQLVPTAVLETMTRSRRIRLHAKLVEVLEDREGSNMAIAHHLIEAFPLLGGLDVIERIRATAAAALIEHDYDSGASLLARCAELPMGERLKAEIMAELGHAYNAAGRQPQALEPFDRTADAARANGWTDLLVSAALGRWGVSPFRASQDRTVIPILDEALTYEAEIDDPTTARLLAKRAAFNLFVGDLDERDALSGRAVSLVGEEPTIERLEVLEARWMAIACPKMVHEVRGLDDELTMLRKELGALTSDACAPEIGIYWRGGGDELRELAAELAADPRNRRDVDQWRTTALAGMAALFEGGFDDARTHTDKALPLGREPWGEAGQVVHGLVHLLIDVLEGRPDPSRDRWEHIATRVPSDSMRATRAWVEAMCGDRAVATELIESAAPGFARLAENFMGGFGLVGAAETALLLERQDLIDPLRTVLEPLSDRMLGHPWAPSLAAADALSRLDAAAGDADASTRHRDEALTLYDSLGADVLAERLDR